MRTILNSDQTEYLLAQLTAIELQYVGRPMPQEVLWEYQSLEWQWKNSVRVFNGGEQRSAPRKPTLILIKKAA